MKENPIILGIETSCDETSAAISINGRIASNIVATQSIHESYGGVVPELASRAHQQYIVSVVSEAFSKSNIRKNETDAIAFTRGPGLLGALLVGCSFTKGMALALGVPLIEVNHMEAHILAHFIEEPYPKFPFLCLTVSGGHTQLVLVEDFLSMKILGQTKDDAVGEAFDKTAKILGLSYPGGPAIDRLAAQGDPTAFRFPMPAIEALNFSFSGIKTAFLYFLRDQIKENTDFVQHRMADICASVQETLINILLQKLIKASEETGICEIAIAGGVSANSGLRKKIRDVASVRGWNIFIPRFEYCTDNAAMIAQAGYYKYLEKQFVNHDVSPLPAMALK